LHFVSFVFEDDEMRSGAGRMVFRFVTLIVLFTSTLGTSCLIAQTNSNADLCWQGWTRQQGLPDNGVLSVMQARDGYVWIGTKTALARFDGRYWQVFNAANVAEMPTGTFCSIAEAGDGHLWISFRHGLLRWNGSAFLRVKLEKNGEKELVGPVFPSQCGGIWVISNTGLWLIKDNTKTCFPLLDALDLKRYSEIEFYSPRETADGIRIGCSRGLIHLNPSSGQIYYEGKSEASPLRFVLGLESDAAGIPWIMYGRGDPFRAWLTQYDSQGWYTNQSIEVYNGARSIFLHRDRSGNLWFPGSQGRVSCWRQGKRYDVSLPNPAAEDFALTMGEDNEGGLWIGTENSGVLRARTRKVKWLSKGEGLPDATTWSVFEARDRSMWIGTDGGASHFTSSEVKHYSETNGLTQNMVRSIGEDGEGRIWIGTGSGLNCLANGSFHNFQFPGEWFNTKVRVVLPASQFLWVGTAKGLYGLDLSTDRHKPAMPPDRLMPIISVYGMDDGLRSHDVLALLETQRGELLIGTAGGGLHRLRNGIVQPWIMDENTSPRSVWALYEDAETAIWLATDRGLIRMKEERSHVFTRQQGLPDDVLNHIVDDRLGHIWLGGERGIYRVPKRELDDVAEGRAPAVHCVSYDEDEGLLTRETNGQKNQPGVIRAHDGRLWFCTSMGVAIFDPQQLPDQTIPPAVNIEFIRINGETIFHNGAGYTISGAINSVIDPRRADVPRHVEAGRIVEVGYTAPTFVAAEQVRFKHRLHGLDDEWIAAGTRRIAQYANLKPGPYRFQVLAANKYGVWNQVGATFSFKVIPFYWQSWWFKCLCGGVVLVVCLGFYHQRMRRHRMIATAERRVAVAIERAEIARDLHDYLGVRITLMQHLSQSLDADLINDKSKDTHRRLAGLANELNASLDSAVWAVQPDKDTLLSLTDYLGNCFHEMLLTSDAELELDFPEKIPEWPLSRPERYHVALAAIEALNNIIKHAQATLVSLRLELNADSFKIVIEDNGRGFEASRHTAQGAAHLRGNGLSNMHKRMELIGGRSEVFSEFGRGTRILITIYPKALRLQVGRQTQK
jgi:ligand-binding sensor domain-containing protein/signal transduction histidine kinase